MFSSFRKRLAVTAAAVVIAGSGLALATANEASAATTYTYFLSNKTQAFVVSSGGKFTKQGASVGLLQSHGISFSPQSYGFQRKSSTGQAYIVNKCNSKGKASIAPSKVSNADLKNIYGSPSVPSTPEIISTTCLK